MKKLCNSICVVVMIAGLTGSLFGLGPFSGFFDKEWETASFEKQVEKNVEDLKKRQKDAQETQTSYKGLLEATQKSVASLKERLQRVRGVEHEYIVQQSSLTTKVAQALVELVEVYGDLKDIISDHIKLLQEYKADPEFKGKGLQLEQKSIYSIEDYQKINTIVLNYDNELKSLEERVKKNLNDYATLKKNQSLANQEFEEKKREQKELKNRSSEERPDRKKFSLKQKGELLDLEERLSQFKKELADAKVKEADAKVHFLEQSIKITKLQLEVLEKEEEHVRHELRIDRKDLVAAEGALKNQIQESNRLQEDYIRRIESLNLLKQNELNQIAQLKKRTASTQVDFDAFYEWTHQPVTVSGWATLIEVGRLHNHSAFEIDAHREMLHARIEQEKAKVMEQEVNSLTIRSWHNLTTGVFDGNHEELAKEIKRYENIKGVIQASMASLSDKKNAASAMLSHNARIVEAIKARLKAFKEQRDTTFKNNPDEFKRLSALLQEEAFVDAQKRGEAIAQLIELYSSISHVRGLTIKKIDSMVAVLQAKAQWKGAPPLWKGIKKFFPEMAKFGQYLIAPGQWTKSFSRAQHSFSAWYKNLREGPAPVVTLLLYLIALGLLYLLLRLYLPVFAMMITNLITPDYGIAHTITSFLAMTIYFVVRHLKSMYVWFLVFYAVYVGSFSTYVAVVFYLLSVPLWIYYVRCFIAYARVVNSARGYVFASKEYQHRFFAVLSTLAYATVVIFLVREAFLIAFPKSDVPHVLLALNFVLFQISLILMISREQVLRLIPKSTPLWQWIFEHIERYYYFFLGAVVFVILMSNPYVGYGPHFFYGISRLILIMLLIPFFVALHSAIKNWLGSFFFYADEEGMKERFVYARSSYGVIIIVSFLVLTFCAILIGLNIWGYSIGFDDVHAWFSKEIDWLGYTSTRTGRKIEVNALDIAKVFLYIFGGAALASFINKFVLRRMFDLLLVNVGVQNVILSLSRYAILIVSVIVGLQSIGLSYSLLYVLAVLGGLGVAGKEIITDFIGYFIILIQRPIKIGDYVRIDNELVGTVRHLTLRSIIMRKNNSVTVIIPNSFILTRPVTNWNYSRTYFAFDDIFLTVVYTADPLKVRTILLQVLDRNINILKNPPPVVRLNDFTDNGFQFMVRGFLSPDKVNQQSDIASEIRLELVRTLRVNGYDVGSPTRVLRVLQEKPIIQDVDNQ